MSFFLALVAKDASRIHLGFEITDGAQVIDQVQIARLMTAAQISYTPHALQ